MRFLVLLFSFIWISTSAQVNLDSLWKVWQNDQVDDSSRHKAMTKFIWSGYLQSQPDSAIYYGNVQLEYALSKNDKPNISKAYNTIGAASYYTDKLPEAAIAFEKALAISLELNDTKSASASYNNLGAIYETQGLYTKSIKYYEKSLKIDIEMDNVRGQISSLGNMANLFQNNKEYEEALRLYLEAYNLAKETDMTSQLANLCLNIAIAYNRTDSIEQSIQFNLEARRIARILDDKIFEVQALINAANTHIYHGNPDTAKLYLDEGLKLAQKINSRSAESSVYENLAILYKAKGDASSAIKYAKLGLSISREMNSMFDVANLTELLWELYRNRDPHLALEYYEEHIQLRDSLRSEKNQKATIRQAYKYQYEKQAAADSVKAAEAAKVKDAEIARQEALADKQDAELENKRSQQYALFGGLGLVLVFSLFIFNRFRVTKKQKGIIEVQKDEVEMQKNEAEHQKELVEEKNKEITDSINYAKRLQEAILPPTRLVMEWLPQSFILYKPKDIVAGDFYWMESVDGWIYFAAADCTGHGVPGAMVSVVCSNALSKALIEEKKTKPSDILDRTRELVIDRFGRSEEEIKDGMDLALCALNWKTGELQYAGANNPLWIIRNGAEEVEEIKADKQPIGKYAEESPFTNHEVKLIKGDSIYIFSDGYPDQFGGPKGKKYKSGKLKKFFLSIQDKDMKTQRQLMSDEFDNWRGEIEQIDDVCVIGVRK